MMCWELEEWEFFYVLGIRTVSLHLGSYQLLEGRVCVWHELLRI